MSLQLTNHSRSFSVTSHVLWVCLVFVLNCYLHCRAESQMTTGTSATQALLHQYSHNTRASRRGGKRSPLTDIRTIGSPTDSWDQVTETSFTKLP